MKKLKSKKNSFILFVIVAATILAIPVLNSLQNSTSETSAQTRQLAPHYIEYSEENLANALQNERVVLYFWAPWCSTCSVLDDELMERSSELHDDVTIIKVNFDTQKDLKQKYFVTTQHALVQIDRNGNEIDKWVGVDVDFLKKMLSY